MPAIQEAFPDDFGVLAWPKLDATTGKPSVPVGAYGSCVNAKSKNVDAAKKVVNENGHARTPILWSPKSGTPYSDALNRIVRSGADPAAEIKKVKTVVESELKRITA